LKLQSDVEVGGTGSWPRLTGWILALARTFFTTGELAGFEAVQTTISAKRMPKICYGSIALFEQLGSSFRALKGAGTCPLYYRQEFRFSALDVCKCFKTITGENRDLRCRRY
jgi:hypothetical protein